MVLERGTLLNDRYRIVEILGQGGMGSVYRAVDENLGVEVAVKDNLFTTEEYARQFRREAIILANLRHPNLPRVTDHFVIEGQGQYLVMDYIEGEDLRQRMDRVGMLPEDEAIVIGAAVCDALTYLGSRKPSIIHRDIKPGNVKITPQGNIFLVDFGLAKTLQGSQATTTGARAMTPGFSPPEQYGTARTDQRTDIFSLGATLYSALTGAVPEDALARAMDQSNLTPVRRHNSRISRRLASVIEKALEVRPDDRYQTAEEFKQALLSASSSARRKEGDYVVTPPPEGESSLPGDSALLPPEVDERLPRSTPQLFPISSPLEDLEQELRARPRKRGRRIGCWLVLLLVIVLISGGLFAILNDPSLPSRAVAQVWPILFAPMATQTVAAPIGDTPIPTMTELTMTEPTLTEQSPTSTPIATATETPLPSSTPESTETPLPTETFTPQPTPLGGGSGQIAFASDSTGTNQIYIINSDGSDRQQITDMTGGACQPNWSPDGTRLVFISPCDVDKAFYPDAAMFIINIDGTGLMPLPTVSNGDYDPAWSPDGFHIAFTSLRSTGRPQIHVYSLEDNSITLLSEKYASDRQPSWSPDGKKIIFISTRQGDAFPQVWMMDADGQNQARFARQNYINSRPSWSPDGSTILFSQQVAAGGVPRLMAAPYPYETYTEYQLTQDPTPMRDGVYSPDGYWIAFNGWQVGSNHDIYIMASNGAGIQQVTEDPRTDFHPCWRPAP